MKDYFDRLFWVTAAKILNAHAPIIKLEKRVKKLERLVKKVRK